MQINGEKFRAAMEAAGAKPMAIAQAGGLSYSRIFQIKTAGISNVNDRAGEAMAKVLKVKPGELK